MNHDRVNRALVFERRFFAFQIVRWLELRKLRKQIAHYEVLLEVVPTEREIEQIQQSLAVLRAKEKELYQ